MLDILYEDNHCLAVNKPAGPADPGGRDRRADAARRGAGLPQGDDTHKPGNVFVGLVHRLDRPTSGVVLLARTSKAAGRLSEQFRDGDGREGLLGRRRGGRARRTRASGPTRSGRTSGGTSSRSSRPGRRGPRGAARVPGARSGAAGRPRWSSGPMTGRSHQLRVQLAARGLPIVGRPEVRGDDDAPGARRQAPGGAARASG